MPEGENQIKVTRPYYAITVGIPAAVVRSYKQPLYDSENIQQATPNADVILFTKPLGQQLFGGAQKTLLHTNMKTAGQLANPQSFDLFGFNLRLSKSISLADFRSFFAAALFTYQVGSDTTFLQVPAEDIPAGVDVEGAAVTDLPHLGWGITDNYYRFDVTGRALHINSQENFQVQITFPTNANAPASDRLVRVYKRGIMYKGL